MIQGNRSFCKASLWENLVKLSSGRLCKNQDQTAGVPASSQEANTRVWFGCKAVKNFLGTLLPCSWPTGAGEHIQDGTIFFPHTFPLKKKKKIHPSLALVTLFPMRSQPPWPQLTGPQRLLFPGRKKEAEAKLINTEGERARSRERWSVCWRPAPLSAQQLRNQLPKPPVPRRAGWTTTFCGFTGFPPTNSLLLMLLWLSQFKWVSLFL